MFSDAAELSLAIYVLFFDVKGTEMEGECFVTLINWQHSKVKFVDTLHVAVLNWLWLPLASHSFQMPDIDKSPECFSVPSIALTSVCSLAWQTAHPHL